jgi:hypothetical protein
VTLFYFIFLPNAADTSQQLSFIPRPLTRVEMAMAKKEHVTLIVCL